MTTHEIISQPEASIDLDKIGRDFVFIKSLQQLAVQNNWRIVVSGGYGLDILLGKITRNHNDVDLILYGASPREHASTTLTSHLNQSINNSEITTKEEIFFTNIDVSSPGLGANIYFVQTVDDPQIDIHRVRKLDGGVVVNSEDRFPSPVMGKLNDLEIEVQNPHTHLADILFKRRKQEQRTTHDQDIKNLELITDKTKVEKILISF